MFTIVNIALRLIPEEIKESVTIFLITDDTLQAKFGDKFDCYGKLFDHTNHTGSSFLNGCRLSSKIDPLFRIKLTH